MSTETPAQRRPPLRRLALEALSVFLLAVGAASWAYRIWDLDDLSIPMYWFFPETLQTLGMLKNMDEHGGWWTHNPMVGYPFGQNLHDHPSGGETLQKIVLKAGLFVGDYATVANLYYLLGYGFLAAVTLVVVRQLRFAYWIALVVALAYTFLVYHFAHSQPHLFRSTYFSAPIACLLMLWALSWRTHFLVDPDPPPGTRVRGNLNRRRVLVALGLAVVVGMTETMTTAFTMTLLGGSAIVAAVRWREPMRLAVSGVLIAVLALSFLAGSAQVINFWLVNGQNTEAATRHYAESEFYSLKISKLVLPAGNYWFGPLGTLGERSQQGAAVASEEGQYVGALGLVGLFFGLVVFLGRGLGRRAGPRDLRPVEDRGALVEHTGLLMILALVTAVPAGFAVVLATLGFEQVRTWNRIVVIIAFLALLVTATLLERVDLRVRERVRRPLPVLAALAIALGAFAVYDGGRPFGGDWASNTAQWRETNAFVDRIDEQMPDDAAIFQFPAIPFPENGAVGAMEDYEHLRGYLADDSEMRWSYGAVKGRRRADWQPRAEELGPVTSLHALLGLGFDGYWIDRRAYEDQAERLRRQLTEHLGTEPIFNDSRTLMFFDLRPYREQLDLSDQQLRDIAYRTFGV